MEKGKSTTYSIRVIFVGQLKSEKKRKNILVTLISRETIILLAPHLIQLAGCCIQQDFVAVILRRSASMGELDTLQGTNIISHPWETENHHLQKVPGRMEYFVSSQEGILYY